MARDANGEVWVERGGQLTALNPHRKVPFDAVRLTVNHVVVRLAASEEERVEHGRVAKVEFDPGPYRPGRPLGGGGPRGARGGGGAPPGANQQHEAGGAGRRGVLGAA
jgi:hypothetical protein